MIEKDRIICGDAKQASLALPDGVVDLTVTLPPYFRHRDYGVNGQLGREASVEEYETNIRGVLTELLRVTAETGACFFVVGDTYESQKLLLVPHRIALAADKIGWTVRNDLIWNKLDPPPESPRNRWRSAHEHVLFLTKRPGKYTFHADAVRVPYADATKKRWGNGQVYGGPKSEERPNHSGFTDASRQDIQVEPEGLLADRCLVAAGRRFIERARCNLPRSPCPANYPRVQ